MTHAMKICKLHGRAHRVTEPCPWCEEPKHTWASSVENVCPDCAVRQYIYPGFVTECLMCGGDV